jgi:hypothetical protein
MPQAGRSPFRVPDEVDFFNLRNPSSHTMALGSIQPLTEMSTRNCRYASICLTSCNDDHFVKMAPTRGPCNEARECGGNKEYSEL